MANQFCALLIRRGEAEGRVGDDLAVWRGVSELQSRDVLWGHARVSHA
ncbi:hypothetical protein [Desulfomicrobium baculatum]|nr:hypothetical protein [Desulfomicrobium baculatum]